MSLGASRLKRVALASVVLAMASMTFLSCGYSSSYYKPPSGLTTRVAASQSVSTPTAFPGLLIIDGANDTIGRGGISAGSSPGLMEISPDRKTLLVFDSVSNSVAVINARTETATGSIPLPGPTTSMVALATGFGYAAVPGAIVNGSPTGGVVVLNLTAGGITATISVPSAQTVVASPDGTKLLVFSNDSDAVTIMSPLLVNTGNPVTVAVPGFDRPVNGVFSADGSTAYILNCGPECASGTASASVQTLDMATSSVGAPLAVDGATIGWLKGSTLYLAGNSPTNNSCAGETTAALTCGRLDIVDLGSMTLTSSVVITDGFHDRIDMSSNGQLFIGSYGCTTIGNVNNPQGEVRGCLSIFDTTTAGNTTAVIPPDNGDVTGLQSFTSRYVEYVAEGGNLRVYDTTKDALLISSFISTGTITISGEIIDVKAIDFF
jgi:YVTN family beta-propeller protein